MQIRSAKFQRPPESLLSCSRAASARLSNFGNDYTHITILFHLVKENLYVKINADRKTCKIEPDFS